MFTHLKRIDGLFIVQIIRRAHDHKVCRCGVNELLPIISGVRDVMFIGKLNSFVAVMARYSNGLDTYFAGSLDVHVGNKPVTECDNLWALHIFTLGNEVTVFHAVEISRSVMSCVLTIEKSSCSLVVYSARDFSDSKNCC